MKILEIKDKKSIHSFFFLIKKSCSAKSGIAECNYKIIVELKKLVLII